VSRRIKKHPQKVKETFLKVLDGYIKNIENYSEHSLGKSVIVSDDARSINAPRFCEKVSLAVTSPPYINAFDYVRSLRLENAWLGYYGDSNITQIKKKQLGTETISSKYYDYSPNTGYSQLDHILKKISKTDKKRATVVKKFFNDRK
jgi:hypothetical protein